MVSDREEFYLPFSLQFILMTFCSHFRTLGLAVSGSLTLLEPSVMLMTWQFHVVLNLIQLKTNLFVSVDVSLLFVRIAFYFVVYLLHFLTL